MRVYKPIDYIRCGDIGIRISEILFSQCSVPGCQKSECYDIQFEKPDNCSFMGGVFCEKHLECIFNFSLAESEDKG